MNKKAMTIGTMSLLLTMMLTGCGGESEEPVETQPYIVAQKATIPEGAQTSTESKTETKPTDDTPTTETPSGTGEPASETSGTTEAIPEPAPLDNSIDLTTVTVNGVELSLTGLTVAQFMENTGLSYFSFASSDSSGMGLTFYGKGFAVPVAEGSMEGGTEVFVQAVQNGELVDEWEESRFEEYKLDGIHSSEFFTDEDFDVLYYGGIKAGMAKEEAEVILGGEGALISVDWSLSSVYAYENSGASIMLEYEDGIIDGVYLFIK